MKILAQILPFRIHTLDQFNLFFPPPSLELLLPCNSVLHLPKRLKVNKLRRLIPRTEPNSCLGLMLKHTSLQVPRHSEIQDTRSTSHKVDVIDHKNADVVPLTPPKAPASDFSPQTASDANTDTPASDRSPYPTSPPAPPSTSTPPPANSAEAAPHSARQSPRCPPSAVAATSSAPPPAPASQPPWKPPPAHPPPCTNIRPPPAAQNPPSCAAGSLSAMAFRARSFPSAVPIPAASTHIQTPSQSTSNTPGARHNTSTHNGPPPPATSTNPSPNI